MANFKNTNQNSRIRLNTDSHHAGDHTSDHNSSDGAKRQT